MGNAAVNSLDTSVNVECLTSETNPRSDLHPAFLDTRTGRVEIARFANGAPAPCHVTHGLPEEWMRRREGHSREKTVEPFVICGFVHHGRFLTRRQAAQFVGALS